MRGHLAIGGVRLGLITIRPADAAFEIVRHRNRRHPAKVPVHLLVAVDPVLDALRTRRAGERIGTRAQDADEQFRFHCRAGLLIRQRQPSQKLTNALSPPRCRCRIVTETRPFHSA